MTNLLAAAQSHYGQDKVQFYAPYIWLYRPENEAIIIKLEETNRPDCLCVNASFARDGSVPLLASFMSMLLIEDSHATTADTIGVCSGMASVTLYHWLDVAQWDAHRLLCYLHNFEKLALCVITQAAASAITQADISQIRPESGQR